LVIAKLISSKPFRKMSVLYFGAALFYFPFIMVLKYENSVSLINTRVVSVSIYPSLRFYNMFEFPKGSVIVANTVPFFTKVL
jgi:hypothetical protein